MPQVPITEMKSEENWVGLYVAGGGVTGVMRALREDGGPARNGSWLSRTN